MELTDVLAVRILTGSVPARFKKRPSSAGPYPASQRPGRPARLAPPIARARLLGNRTFASLRRARLKFSPPEMPF